MVGERFWVRLRSIKIGEVARGPVLGDLDPLLYFTDAGQVLVHLPLVALPEVAVQGRGIVGDVIEDTFTQQRSPGLTFTGLGKIARAE